MRKILLLVVLLLFITVSCDDGKTTKPEQTDNDTIPAIDEDTATTDTETDEDAVVDSENDEDITVPDTETDEDTVPDNESDEDITAPDTETDEDVETSDEDADIFVTKCGNSIKDEGEICELGETIECSAIEGETYPQGKYTICNDDCSGWKNSLCETCGNRILDTGETCETGSAIDCSMIPGKNYITGTTAVCNEMCTGWNDETVCQLCGNGHLDSGEECDDANLSNEDSCLNDCKANICGDGYKNEGFEECDDGNVINEDSCLNSCKLNICGDGYVNEGVELCDSNTKACSLYLGNQYGGEAPCSSTCDEWVIENSCTQVYTCPDKPEKTVWNTVSEYTQTFDGTKWVPIETTPEYNTESSTTSCRYTCKEGEIKTVACQTDGTLFQKQICNAQKLWENQGDCIEEMVTIPAGPFMMGCNQFVDNANECGEGEKPYHQVTLSEYKIDKYEVTAAAYKACIDSGSCSNENSLNQLYVDGSNAVQPGKESHPMNNVSWYGAKAYCEWAGKRLPTEAEWEKAARGTDERIYPWGNETATCEYTIMSEGTSFDDMRMSCGAGNVAWEIGSRAKDMSPYGVYDMTGNVQEWVNDWYDKDYYSVLPATDPQGAASGTDRVIRGESFGTLAEYLYQMRVSKRVFASPDVVYAGLGFRCAK